MVDTTLPVAVADTALVTIGAVAQATGNVLANDSDPDGDTLTVASVDGQASAVGTTIVGTYGSLVLGANGQYTYTLAGNQANVLALTPGQTVTDVFNYTISDGNPHTVTTTVTNQNLITQSEAFDNAAWVKFSDSGAAPKVTANVAVGPQGTAQTADQVTLSGVNKGLYFVTPVTGQYTFSVWIKLVSGDGHIDFNYYDGTNGALQTVVATSTWQLFSFTFTGDGNANANVALMHDATESASGTFQLWGAQLNPGATATTYLPTTGTAASVTTTTTTNVVVGSTLTVSVQDPAASGGTTPPPVAVNDTASVKVNAVTQAAGNVLANDSDPNGNPLTVVSVNGQAGGVGTTIVGTYGTLVLGANGQYTYTLASNQANVQALAPGQTVTDVFQYTISDGATHTTTTTVTNQNLIIQSEAFNTSPWVSFADSGAAPTVTANVAVGAQGTAQTADQITLSGVNKGLYYVTPVTGQYTFSVWVKLVSGDGHIDLNYYDGSNSLSETVVATGTWQRFSWTFTGTGNADANVALMHDASESASGTFQIWGAQLNPGATPTTYLPTTGTAASVTTTTTNNDVVGAALTVSVQGAAATGGSTAAPIVFGDHAAVSTIGALSATGNVLTNDSAPSGNALTVASVDGQASAVGTTIAGTYGTLVLGANGQYTYTLASNQANVQALAPGQTVTDVFQYTASDGLTHTQTNSVITGQNFILQSEAFNLSPWVSFAGSGAGPTVTPNVAVGPQGTAQTADQITLSGVNKGLYYVAPESGQYTFSVWIKLVSGDGHIDFNYYDGTNGTLQTVVATSTWQRFSFTFTGDANANANVALMHDATESASGTFQLWGAQLNPGATSGDYVATTGHYDSVFTPTTTTPVSSGDLTITISGGNPAAIAPNTLNFAGGTQGVVVNLATDQWTHPLQVLPLGDSITYGWTSLDYQVGQTNTEDGYRGPLWWDFVSQSMLINMVGPNTSGDQYLPDQGHAGYPGYRSDQIAAQLPAILASNHLDAILLMAGTNDIFQETSPAAHVAASIAGMISTVMAASPSTHVYVATLMPINQAQDGEPGDASMVAAVNTAIETTVTQAIAAGDNVSLVDMSSMTLSDIADAAHPTADGYAKLAQIWYNAILAQQPDSGGTPGGATNTIASGTNTVIGTEANDLLIANNQGDTLSGGGGDDRLVSGAGNDTLTGGTGADQFVFTPTSGHATITDFSHTDADHIELDGFTGLTQFSQLASHITTSGTTTTIDLSSFGSHTMITLPHLSAPLAASDFWFG